MKHARSAPSVGAPVNPVLGAKVLSGDEDLDFTLEGPLPLAWQRSYSSANAHVGWFGRGWGSPLEPCLLVRPDPSGDTVDRVDYVDPFGRHVEFPYVPPGGDFLSLSEQLTLRRTPQGQYCVEDGDGVTYWFNPQGGGRHRVSTINDRNDNAVHIDYREQAGELQAAYVSCSGGQVLEITFARSRVTEVAQKRSAAGGPERVAWARYRYDAQGQLREVVNRAGEVVRAFEYNPDGLMTHQVHGAFESWYEYAGSGREARVTRHWDNAGGRWTFDYLEDRTVVRDELDRTYVYHFDAKRRWTGTTDPAGGFTRRALDRNGNLRAVIDPAGNVTEAVFDARGNPVELRDATGAITRIEWHEQFGEPLAIIDPLNGTTKYAYDDRGNLVAETDATGAKTTYKRDARGLPVEVIDAHGGINRLEYNELGQVVRSTDCSARSTTLEYDDNGWLTGVVDALGQRTTYAYDAAGRLARHTLADGSFEDYEYDVRGELLSVTDTLEHRTRFEYTPDALLARRIDALGGTFTYRYDRGRRLTELVNENGVSYRFAHDVLNRVVDETRFDGIRVAYRYDAADRVVEKAEAPETPQAIVTRYERDAEGRVLARLAGTRQTWYEYDAAGQLVHAREPGVALHLAYDPAGQVVAEELVTPGRSFKVSHTYDALGNRLQSKLPDGTKVATLYYGSGHAHQLRIDDQAISDIERDALHRETARSQGALQTSRGYDAAGRLQRLLTTFGGARAAPPGAAPAAALIERLFRYDRAGRLAAATDRGRSFAYDHDALGRLTRFNDERFAFDPAGNLAPTGGAPGASSGQVTAGHVAVHEDKRFRYDAHARLVEKRIGAHTTVQLKWDDGHRLAESITHTPHKTVTARYLYDPLGRRIGKETPAGVTWYVWVEDQLVQQITDQHRHTFVYEPDSFTPLALHSRPAAGPGEPRPAGTVSYYHCDQIGLPRELTDADGSIRWEADYTAWGALKREVFAPAPPAGTNGAVIQPLRFEGQYHDEETGLHYNRFRYYDPDLAAYVTPDPIGLEGGDNLHQYAPSPVDWTDPYGLTQRRRKNGRFAKRPGPEKKKKHSGHGCSLTTTKPAQGYELRDLSTGEVQKYGETTLGKGRYTKAELQSENVEMVFIGRKGTKKQKKDWETKKIRAYKKKHGCRPRLNKSDH